MNKKVIPFLIALCLLMSSSFKAQSLDETLSKLSSTVGSAYVKPIISAFGSNLNSGWVSRVPEATMLGFHLDIKVVAMGSFFPNDLKTFSASDQFYFDNDQIGAILNGSGYATGSSQYNAIMAAMQNKPFNVNFSGPTIIGKESEYLKILFPGQTISASGQSYTVQSKQIDIKEVKGFLDELPALPTAAAQLTLGTVYGTNIAIRYLPDVEIQDLGKFSYFGVGLIHNFGIWFPNPLPLDLAVGAFTQTLKVGTIFESKATQFGVYASKTFGKVISVTPYAGLTMETSKTTVGYDYVSNQTLNGVPVKARFNIDLEGNNTTSAVVGFNLHLGILNINADYKLANTPSVSAGVSFGF
ncbi:MAG: hypothetical protein CVV24_10855 [Ignavibacteriae bacterium HGW-Ignavibacteriae-3]|nr:MAG: hypothetical protein CVV24_10855 [Ignavibacteriae bacterium HGW-Ignavibacteriae-3]